jgi:hypothetical protein
MEEAHLRLEEAHLMRNWTLAVALLLLAGCGSDDDPSTPSPVTPSPTPTPAPTPTPTASSPYAGNWTYRATLTAVDDNCGHTPADIGKAEGPFGVTIASDGTFTLPGGQGSITSSGEISFTLVAGAGDCRSGSGAGGCATADHCDGTSVQAGDVKKWTLVR